MSHHKTRKNKSRHNKTRGGGKGKSKKDRRYSYSGKTATGASYNPPRLPPIPTKTKTNAKHYYAPAHAIAKSNWNALTTAEKRQAEIYGIGPNKD